MQGSSAAGAGYGGASGYGQSGYGTSAQAADTSSNFGGNMGTSGYGNDTSGYGSSAYGQVSPLACMSLFLLDAGPEALSPGGIHK